MTEALDSMDQKMIDHQGVGAATADAGKADGVELVGPNGVLGVSAVVASALSSRTRAVTIIDMGIGRVKIRPSTPHVSVGDSSSACWSSVRMF